MGGTGKGQLGAEAENPVQTERAPEGPDRESGLWAVPERAAGSGVS